MIGGGGLIDAEKIAGAVGVAVVEKTARAVVEALEVDLGDEGDAGQEDAEADKDGAAEEEEEKAVEPRASHSRWSSA